MLSPIQQVMVRHALHRIANLVFYEDRYGHSMLALKVGDKTNDVYDVYVYEAMSPVSLCAASIRPSYCGHHTVEITTGNYVHN